MANVYLLPDFEDGEEQASGAQDRYTLKISNFLLG